MQTKCYRHVCCCFCIHIVTAKCYLFKCFYDHNWHKLCLLCIRISGQLLTNSKRSKIVSQILFLSVTSKSDKGGLIVGRLQYSLRERVVLIYELACKLLEKYVGGFTNTIYNFRPVMQLYNALYKVVTAHFSLYSRRTI